MKNFPYQQALPFTIDDSSGFDSLVTGANGMLITSLQQAVEQKSNDFFFMFGPHGCGKTHLLRSLMRKVADPMHNLFAVDLKLVDSFPPELLHVEPFPVMILDNIDAIAGDDAWELSLFGLFNRWTDRGRGVLIAAASTSADLIPFNRHDLNTRFESGITCPMERLNEEDCVKALLLRARMRGIAMQPKVASFLVSHCNLDMPSLISILDRLDSASLQAQHELTIPFVKKILKV